MGSIRTLSHARAVQVGEVRDDAQPFQLGHEVATEGRKPAVLVGAHGHRISGLVGLEVNDSEHAETSPMGFAQVIQAPLDPGCPLQADQTGGWGQTSIFLNLYKFKANVRIGDGANETWFLVKNEHISIRKPWAVFPKGGLVFGAAEL